MTDRSLRPVAPWAAQVQLLHEVFVVLVIGELGDRVVVQWLDGPRAGALGWPHREEVRPLPEPVVPPQAEPPARPLDAVS